MDESRRLFMKQAAASVAVGSMDLHQAGALLLQQGQTGQAPVQVGWYDKPMRWAQVCFVEDDPGNYDLAFWLNYFKVTHCEAACLNAGGVVAFYPTEVPLHYRSKWLGKGDAFGEILAGCRKLGMNVIARTDSHACHQDVYDAHPDWIAVDAAGKKRRHPSDPELWLTCARGPYNFEFMTAVHEEIMQKYMPDGIFTNRWAGSGMCFCEHCRANFRASSGMELPHTLDPQDPARREYLLWSEKRLFELWQLWNTRIQAINPQASYLANAGGGALSELDMKTIGELAPTLFADRQGRSGLMPPWGNGKNAKEYRATMGRKAVGGIFSVGVEERYRWKDSVQSGDEIRLWVADGIANGLRPWFTKFNAKVIDERWLPVVEEIYKWHYANAAYLRNVRPLARVAMVYSQQTAAFYGGTEARAKVEDPALGFYEALVEARIPFEMMHDRLLDPEHISQFRTLIFPNIAALSTKQCDQVRAFVESGGSVIATSETSLYDEWGVRRTDFGLGGLFGVAYAGEVEGPMLNSYLKLQSEEAHPLLAGFTGVPRIINAVRQVKVVPIGTDTVSPVLIVPSYPDLPMEEVFQRPPKTSGPGVYLREQGNGRVVYFPGDIDRTFWEILNVDHGRLLANAVRWATNERAPVTVEGIGVVDLTVWEQASSMTVHLVNLTNPMMMKGPIREVIPLPHQTVSVQVPAGRRVHRARLLVAGRDVPFHTNDGRVQVVAPVVGIHEVVALDFSAQST